MVILNMATRDYGLMRQMKTVRVLNDEIELVYPSFHDILVAVRKMVRERAFDICEMPFTTYICAKEYAKKFTALPVFITRNFHHWAIFRSTTAGIETPKDLEGKTVGVARGYTVTTGVWARAIIQDEYGVDLSSVTWTPSGDEHVEAYRAPENVVLLEDGDLEGRLSSGGLVAAVGAKVDHPDVAAMIDDPFAAGVSALKTRGFYPINHVMVVRDALLEEMPEVATQVFDAFAASKRQYVDDLKAGRIAEPSRVDKVHLAAMEFMDDPLPYGIEPNRHTLEGLIGHAVTQKIIPQPVALEDLFAGPVVDSVA